MAPRYVLGIDIGGTFTDVLALDLDTGHTLSAKVPTTPGRLVTGIHEGIQLLDITLQDVARIVHGSTTCTNVLLERKQARTGFLGTRGFNDEFEIQRMARRWSKTSWSAIYDLHQAKPAPFIPRHLRRELDERMAYPGVVVKDLDEAEARAAAGELVQQGVSALAVCLLWSTVNPAHERRVKRTVEESFPGIPVSISTEVAPVVREYERMVTTAVNASLMPVMSGYLGTVEEDLHALGFAGELLLMQSHGGIAHPSVLKDRPIFTLRGGPVAGVVAANRLGEELGKSRIISCDIGGTSCDTAVIIDHTIPVSDETEVNYYPIKVPTADIRCIGAGGGSIASIDAGGGLKVGPESAGASPGPACYGSGTQPTLTDANLVLGRLSSNEFCGGRIPLDTAAARRSLEPLARWLQSDVVAAAHGVVRVAVANMAQSIRLQTIDRGHDPREFSLVAFGGGGPLHAALLAEACSIPEVIVPAEPGVFSSMGMLVAELGDYQQEGFLVPLAQVDPADLSRRLERMEAAGRALLNRSAAQNGQLRTRRFAAMRYRLQEWEIRVPLPSGALDADSLDQIAAAFHAAHHGRHGFARPEKPVEFVTLYVDTIAAAPRRRQARATGDGDPTGALKGSMKVYLDENRGFDLVPVYNRAQLEAGDRIPAPSIIEESTSTTFLPPHWNAVVDSMGNLVLAPVEQAKGDSDAA